MDVAAFGEDVRAVVDALNPHKVILAGHSIEVAIPCLRAVLSYDARPTLRAVRVPAYAVNADLYPTDIEDNRRHFASYDVTVMTGVGHYLMPEDATRFSELLGEAGSTLAARQPGR